MSQATADDPAAVGHVSNGACGVNFLGMLLCHIVSELCAHLSAKAPPRGTALLSHYYAWNSVLSRTDEGGSDEPPQVPSYDRYRWRDHCRQLIPSTCDCSGHPRVEDGVDFRQEFSWPWHVGEPAGRADQDRERWQAAHQLYNANELVGPLEVFDVVSKGDADIYFSSEYYYLGKSKAFGFFGAVPFGLTMDEYYAWLYYGGGQKLWDELSAQFNLKPFVSSNTGVQMGGWFNKEIKTLDDFKGLKFRMPGIGGEVLRRMGAAVVTLPPPEIYPGAAVWHDRRHRMDRAVARSCIRLLQDRQVLLLAGLS